MPVDTDSKQRCAWCGNDPLYISYHDHEWGKPVSDDRVLFEFLTLESAQAGLAWITILRKREGYRRAFHNFDPHAVACMTEADVDRLMSDNSIVKNRLKIRSAISNAQHFCEIVDEYGSFYNYVMGFLPDGKPIINPVAEQQDIAVSSPVSDAMSKDMRRRGFKFFGTTICYAFLQATGFIDDHINSCFCKTKI